MPLIPRPPARSACAESALTDEQGKWFQKLFEPGEIYQPKAAWVCMLKECFDPVPLREQVAQSKEALPSDAQMVVAARSYLLSGNIKLALFFFKRSAAEQGAERPGNPAAQYALAMLYFWGLGDLSSISRPARIQIAEKFLRASGDQGNQLARRAYHHMNDFSMPSAPEAYSQRGGGSKALNRLGSGGVMVVNANLKPGRYQLPAAVANATTVADSSAKAIFHKARRVSSVEPFGNFLMRTHSIASASDAVASARTSRAGSIVPAGSRRDSAM